jgi:hypothetical protein
MSKMALHEPFGHLQHKLWLKEGSGVKLAIWLPTTKSRESTWSRYVQVECDTPLESSQGELQVSLNLVPIGGWGEKLWTPKLVPKIQIGIVSGLHFGSPEKKCHSDVNAMERHKEYYIGEGGGFPRVRAVVSQMSPCCLWLVPTPRVFSKCDLTNLLVGFDAGPSN